jgi:hypothetical protein
MVVSVQNVETVKHELRSTISRKLSGRYAQLAKADEFFVANSDDVIKLLQNVSDAFSKVVHDILNLRTIFLRFDTMLSVPDLDQNQLHRFLEADIDLFFSYTQSIFDYVTEGVDCVFSYKLSDHPSFWGLWKKYNQKGRGFVPKDLIEDSLAKLITVNESEWIRGVREIRNTLIHRGADPRVMIEFRSQEAMFQILQNSNPLIGNEVHTMLYSDDTPVYLSFKAYAGIALGRLIAFANSVAELCYEQLGTTLNETIRASILSIDLPNIAVAVDWIDFGLKRISEVAVPTPSQRSLVELNPDDLVTRDNLVAYLDRKILDLTRRPLQAHEVLEGIITVNGLLKMLTTSVKALCAPPWQKEESVYSFKAECAMRKFKSKPGESLRTLLLLLDNIRNEIAASNQLQFGEIGPNCRIDMLDTMTAPIPPLVPGLRLYPQPIRINL